MLRARLGPIRYEILRGDRISAGNGRQVAVVRALSFTRRRAMVGQERVGAQGLVWVRLRPLALMDERHGIRRIMLIPDPTRWALALILLYSISTWFATRAVKRVITGETGRKD
jgi:hypothetical protein